MVSSPTRWSNTVPARQAANASPRYSGQLCPTKPECLPDEGRRPQAKEPFGRLAHSCWPSSHMARDLVAKHELSAYPYYRAEWQQNACCEQSPSQNCANYLVSERVEGEEVHLPRGQSRSAVGQRLTTQGQLQACLHAFDPRSQHPRSIQQEHQWTLTYLRSRGWVKPGTVPNSNRCRRL